VEDAKRAGLWVDDEMMRGQDGWKHKKSAWAKYPQRMLSYRALGFLARDLFADILSGIYTTEEAIDMPQDTEIIIETDSGANAVIHDQDFSEDRSKTLTQNATELIEKTAGNIADAPGEKKETPMETKEDIPEANVVEEKPPFEADESQVDKSWPMFGKNQRGWCPDASGDKVTSFPVYTEEEMKSIDLGILMKIISMDDEMFNATKDGTRNTNKKLRTIILAKYAGSVTGGLETAPQEQTTSAPEHTPDPPVEENPDEIIPDDGPPQEEPDREGIEHNADFEKGREDIQQASPPAEGNKFDMIIEDVPEGEDRRAFEAIMPLFNDLESIAGVGNERYLALLPKFPELQKYKNREDFCAMASAEEINNFLNKI
ncbi:unnamed protein product, partial [marine sediment metagenome]